MLLGTRQRVRCGETTLDRRRSHPGAGIAGTALRLFPAYLNRQLARTFSRNGSSHPVFAGNWLTNREARADAATIPNGAAFVLVCSLFRSRFIAWRVEAY